MPDALPDSTNAPAGRAEVHDADQLTALKRLLFAQEQAELDRLKDEVHASRLGADQLSELLPGAVRKAASRDTRLAKSLGPLIGNALRNSIKSDPQSVVDAISPIMGPAIRDSIRQAIRGMIQSLNKALEYSVSWKGLQWRWEAWKTGKPFAEVVLLHTLLYRVEQVFLIHRETGLLLQHLTLDADVRDVDLTSGMLTAIQDFVRDSFGAAEHEALQTMDFGQQTVWIETGPRVFLAAVIEGEAPLAVRVRLRECLESIQVDFSRELDGFRGESAPFVAAQPLLSECLMTAYESDQRDESPHDSTAADFRTARPSRWKQIAWGTAGVALLVVTLLLLSRWRTSERLEQIRRLLAVPETVQIELQGRELRLLGSARHEWIEQVREAALRLPYVEQVDLSAVENLDAEWLRYVADLRNQPGLVVTRSERRSGEYYLEGLRDPLAVDPGALLARYRVAPEAVEAHWRPFPSWEQPLLVRRVANALDLPPGVKLEIEGDSLHLVGSCTAAWLDAARRQVAAMGAGLVKLNITRLDDLDDARLREMSQRIEQHVVFHEPNGTALQAGQDATLQAVAEEIQQLIRTARTLRRLIRIRIVGYARQDEGVTPPDVPPGGAEQRARRLSQERAREVWQRLRELRVATDDIVIQGRGATEIPNPPAGITPENTHRCSLFYVRLDFDEGAEP